MYYSLMRQFLAGMQFLSEDTAIVAIHAKKPFSAVPILLGSTQVFYAASSPDLLAKVLLNGFGVGVEANELPEKGVTYGEGIYLYPASVFGSLSAVPENGVKHLLVCRLNLDELEVIAPGTKQLPASDAYKIGVDNAVDPSRYIIWQNLARLHINTVCIVSFRTPKIREFLLIRKLRGTPSLGSISSSHMMFMMSKCLPLPMFELIYNRLKNVADETRRAQIIVELAGENWWDHYADMVEKA